MRDEPLVPTPGLRRRSAVLRTGSARSRLLVAALGAAVIAIIAVAVTSGIQRGGSVAPPTDGPVTPFVPAVRRVGAVELLQMTMLDGRRLELRYPPSLGIAQLGLTLAAEMSWPAGAPPSTCCSAEVSVSRATIVGAYGSERPLATYPGVQGRPVWLLSSADRRLPPGFTGSQNLVFQFSGWLVEVDTSPIAADGVPPPMTDEDLRMWASNLRASTAAGGYLVLHPHPPLALAEDALISSRSATFGLGSPNAPQGNTLDIEDGYCGQPTSDTSVRRHFQTDDGLAGVAWCDPGSGLHISAIGQPQFVGLVASQLMLTATGGNAG